MTRPFAAMRHRLQLQAPVETADGAGGVVRGWTTLATLWAAIDPLGAEPGLWGEAPSSPARHRITLRWRADLLAGQRLVKGGRTFLVRAVIDPDERRRRLVLAVEEID